MEDRENLIFRRFAQSLMLQFNMVPHLHDLLENIHANKLSEYTLEFGVSLLMNLCMRSAGKRACLDLPGREDGVPGKRTLSLMTDLLQYENEQVKTHVTVILYNLFSVSDIRDEAKAMNIVETLYSAKNDLDDRFERQVDFIIDILEGLFIVF